MSNIVRCAFQQSSGIWGILRSGHRTSGTSRDRTGTPCFWDDRNKQGKLSVDGIKCLVLGASSQQSLRLTCSFISCNSCCSFWTSSNAKLFKFVFWVGFVIVTPVDGVPLELTVLFIATPAPHLLMPTIVLVSFFSSLHADTYRITENREINLSFFKNSLRL